MADRELIDPLGRLVILHDRTWFGHILKAHPELSDYYHLIPAAVIGPDEIKVSRADPGCRLYFLQSPKDGVRMVVVADLEERVIKTAHLCREVSGGKHEWP